MPRALVPWLTLVALALLGALPSPAAAKKLAPGESVDLNTATVEQLSQVPGIGRKKATDVIAYRDAHGPFTSVDQLDHVKGFGKKALARVAPYLRLGGAAPSAAVAAPPADEPEKKPAKARKAKAPRPEASDDAPSEPGEHDAAPAPHGNTKAPTTVPKDEGTGSGDVETL